MGTNSMVTDSATMNQPTSPLGILSLKRDKHLFDGILGCIYISHSINVSFCVSPYFYNMVKKKKNRNTFKVAEMSLNLAPCLFLKERQ